MIRIHLKTKIEVHDPTATCFFHKEEKKDKEEKNLNQFYNYQGYFLAYTKNLNIQSLRKQRTQSKIEACGAAEMIQQPRAHTAHP